MCYHASVTSSQEVLQERFNATFAPEVSLDVYYHANGFAVPKLPVITQENPQEIDVYQWSLIASFAKDSAHAKKLRIGTLNAKAETVFELSSFRSPILKKRCLVLADAFFESRTVAGVKYPYKIHRQDKQPFAFAGLYNYWKDEHGTWHKTFTIVTTVPNKMMSVIHNEKLRMPVILPIDKERKWIDPTLLKEEIIDLMQPLEDGVLAAHTVDNRINQSKVYSNEPWAVDVCEYPGVEAVLS